MKINIKHNVSKYNLERNVFFPAKYAYRKTAF